MHQSIDSIIFSLERNASLKPGLYRYFLMNLSTGLDQRIVTTEKHKLYGWKFFTRYISWRMIQLNMYIDLYTHIGIIRSVCFLYKITMNLRSWRPKSLVCCEAVTAAGFVVCSQVARCSMDKESLVLPMLFNYIYASLQCAAMYIHHTKEALML